MRRIGGKVGNSEWEEVPRSQNKIVGQSRIRGKVDDPVLMDKIQAFNKAWKHKKRVLICEPSLGVVDYQAHESCWDLAFEMSRYETRSDYKFFKIGIGRTLPAYAREKGAEFAVDYEFNYIFYLDDDHIWPNNIFEILEKHITEYEIVAPLCVQRKSPFEAVIYQAEYKTEDDKVFYSNEFKRDWKQGDLVTGADSIGMGAAIIDVELLKRMGQPWFFSMQPVGEDILFTLKATSLYGAKILVDTNIEAPHLQERPVVSWRNHLEATKKN